MCFILNNTSKQTFTTGGAKMVFNSNKEKGNSGLGIAIAYFTSNGYVVSIPLNDTQDYDLIIEKDKKLKTIQVKATSCKTKNGNYQVALKSCGGTKGTTYKTFVDTNVDSLFVVTDKKQMYFIDKEIIKNRSTLNLCNKYEKYRVFL